MKLSGNTILITGGTAGIGFGLARALSSSNRVLICGRRPDRLERARAQLPSIDIFACDVGSPTGRRDLAKWALATAPELNVLVNNAGVQHRIDLLDGNADDGGHYEEISINLEAPIHLCGLFIPHLIGRREAAIVNVTSGLAFTPYAAVPVYCATKAALHSYSLSLRYQLRDTSIRIFEVAPPLVQSELHDHQKGAVPPTAGMPVDDFVAACLQGLETDLYFNPVGMAAGLHQKREASFSFLNPA